MDKFEPLIESSAISVLSFDPQNWNYYTYELLAEGVLNLFKLSRIFYFYFVYKFISSLLLFYLMYIGEGYAVLKLFGLLTYDWLIFTGDSLFVFEGSKN